jgi:hypothetical protein
MHNTVMNNSETEHNVNLTDQEMEKVIMTGGQFAQIMAFLFTLSCGAEKKNSFFHIALGIGIVEAKKRFHPTKGGDPCRALDPRTIPELGTIFKDTTQTSPHEQKLRPTSPPFTVAQPFCGDYKFLRRPQRRFNECQYCHQNHRGQCGRPTSNKK